MLEAILRTLEHLRPCHPLENSAVSDPLEPHRELDARMATLEARLPALAEQVKRQQVTYSIISDVVRFGPLQELLRAGRFTEADRETARVLYECINSSVVEITPEMIETFPATPLVIVNRLWRQASGGRFGFTVQLEIYLGLDGSLGTLVAQDLTRFRAFCERIGWSEDGRLIDPDASADTDEADAEVIERGESTSSDALLKTLPHGALPRRFWITPYGMKAANLILARLITAGFEAEADAAVVQPPAGGPTG